jgi:antitoxin (DNA-binding transcriptional repressor) of toxin-antitoxin stability system
MDVGVRELKAKLSEYLDRAERGETIRVTHRGRAKALLGPPGTAAEAIERGIEEGWLVLGEAESPAPVVRTRSGRRSDDVLAEDRGL